MSQTEDRLPVELLKGQHGKRQAARANAYEAAKLVSFENKYMRKDIGKAIDEA